MRRDYFYIALNDLQSANDLRRLKHYNNATVLAQQTAEKLLKSIAECILTDEEDYRKLHKLQRIQSVMETKCPDEVPHLEQESLAYLTDFYFDARYPGDNYIDVTEEMCDKCFEIMDRVLEAVLKWREERGLYTAIEDEHSSLANVISGI